MPDTEVNEFGVPLTPDTTQSQSNGAPGSNGAAKRPSMSQLMVGSEGSDFFDLTKELLRGSENFWELLPKARFNEEEGAAVVRLMMDEDQYEDGYIDGRKLVFNKSLLSMGKDGMAREEALRAHTGGQGWRANLGGMARGFVDHFRSQNNNTAQREGPA